MALPISEIAKFCNENLDFSIELTDVDWYSNIPLSALDSVFSIGIRYEAVVNIIRRTRGLLAEHKIAEDQLTTTQFLKITQPLYPEILTRDYYSYHRTSATNGILKTEALQHFLLVLQKYGVETLEDLSQIKDVESFEREIRNIKGQASGISLKYFYMLTGNEDLVKPDRMIQKFVNRFIFITDKNDEIQFLLRDVAKELSVLRNSHITPRYLDHIIWRYESGRDGKLAS